MVKSPIFHGRISPVSMVQSSSPRKCPSIVDKIQILDGEFVAFVASFARLKPHFPKDGASQL